jgi:hypothetical protein
MNVRGGEEKGESRKSDGDEPLKCAGRRSKKTKEGGKVAIIH